MYQSVSVLSATVHSSVRRFLQLPEPVSTGTGLVGLLEMLTPRIIAISLCT